MPLRIVFDTNLWISYLISPQTLRLEDIWEAREVVVLFSPELLSEFVKVARRPKFRRYFPVDRIQIVLDVLDEFGVLVDAESNIATCRDQKDNFLLALSLDGNADFLITGDADLLDIKEFEHTRILTLSEFAKRTLG